MNCLVKCLARCLVASSALAMGCAAPIADSVDVSQIARLEGARTGAAKLAEMSSHPDARVRARALRAMARLQDPASLSRSIAALADPDAGVRREAAFAIQALGLSWEPLDEGTRARAEAAVRAALAGAKETDKADLYSALGAVAGDEGAALLAKASMEDSNSGAAAALALGNWIQRNKKKDWNGVLPDKSGSTPVVKRARAYLWFRAANTVDEGVMAAGLGEGDAEVRALCARALGAKKTERQAAALTRSAVRDEDWRVRVEAVRALAAAARAESQGKGSAANGFSLAITAAALTLDGEVYDSAEIAEPLLELTAEYGFNGVGDSKASAMAISQSSPLATMTFWAAFESTAPDAVMGAAARRVLPGIARARAKATGTAKFDLARIECAAAAAVDKVSGRIDELSLCGGDAITGEGRERVIAKALANHHFAGREIELMKRVRSADRVTRALAIESIGKGDKASIGPEARRLVIEALSDPDGPVVATAAEAEEAILDEESIEPLVSALARFEKPVDAEIEQSLASALGALKAQAAAPALRRLLSNGSPAVRLAAKKALAEMKMEAGPVPAPAAESLKTFARPKETRLRLKTDKGVIAITLLSDEAPSTAGAIADLARKGFYDGLSFHRVVPDFVAQGGDPRGDGWGGPGFTIPCEVSPNRYERGSVGMALSGKDTGGSQLFITHSAQPHLDGRYTILGRVTEGMEVVDRLLPGDRIVAMRPE